MNEGGMILVIDDELQIRRFLKISLESGGYNVAEAGTGELGMSLAASVNPDAIILDLGLPDMDGLEFIKRLREWSGIPVIVLTVKDSEKDKVAMLDSGADDYLTKPFSVNELKARIRVAYRHRHKEQKGKEQLVFTSGKLSIDFDKRIVKVNGKKLKFTPKEYAVLTLLAKNAGRVMTQNQILRELWGPHNQEESQYLRIYIMQIRRKIEDDPANPAMIQTEPGVGYRFTVNEEEL